VPELAGLIAQGIDEGRMGMAEGGDGDSGDEIEIPAAILGVEIGALAFDEDFLRRTIDRQDVLAGVLVEIVLWHRGGSGNCAGIGVSATLGGGRTPSQLSVPDYGDLIVWMIE
jgi:hypothetical protein